MHNIHWARGVGHTKALLEGAKNVDGVIIVAHTKRFADELARQCRDAIGIGIENLQYLVGQHRPIVIDHLAIEILLNERDKEMERRRLLYLEGLAAMAEEQRTQFARVIELEEEKTLALAQMDEAIEEYGKVITENEALSELKRAAKAWAWHQGKSGGKYYTSAPSEMIAKNGAKKRLLKAVEEFNAN